jgi:hypothetical protein
LDAFIDSQRGFWLIYNVGVAAYPYHFRAITDALNKSRSEGFGYLHEAHFHCVPTLDSAPDLGNCNDERPSLCKFGRGRAVLHKAFDSYLAMALAPEDREQRQRATFERDRILQAEAANLHFVSDSTRRVVFYFAKLSEQWRLVAADTSDCSA